MSTPCACDQPDIALLRVILIGEIVAAEDGVVERLADLCVSMNIFDPPAYAEPPAPKRHLRSVP